MDRIEEAANDLRTRFGAIDEVVVAYGVLGEQAAAEQDLAQARALIDSNFTSAALWVLALLKGRAENAPLTIVGIGSVAGDKGRASNFIYGSAKAAFDRFLEGLAHKYDGSAVRIVRVKPGFVDTPMTAGIAEGRAALGDARPRRGRHRTCRREGPSRRLHALVLVGDHDDHPPPAVVRIPAAQDLMAWRDQDRAHRRRRARRAEPDPASQGARLRQHRGARQA